MVIGDRMAATLWYIMVLFMFSLKTAPSLYGIGSSIYGAYGLPESSQQMTSRSVQPFLYGPKC